MEILPRTDRDGVKKRKTPLSWNASSIKWKKEITGSGQSSVVQSGGKLFLTSADREGGLRFIHCLDKDTGELLWKKEVKNSREEAVHRMNTWATPTPVTDGNKVVAFFGPAGLHCFDLEGKKLWDVDLGDFPGSWGVAASPVIVDGLVLQNCDSMGPSRLVALDLNSGKIAWETKRETKPRGGWSTPIVISVQGERQIVLNGEFGARGYSLADGKELWFCQSFNGAAHVPFYDGKLIFVVNGKPGDLYAIDPTGRGDLTKTHEMACQTQRRSGSPFAGLGKRTRLGNKHERNHHLLRRPKWQNTLGRSVERGFSVLPSFPADFITSRTRAGRPTSSSPIGKD